MSTITLPPSSTSSITHIYTEIESSNEKFGIDAPGDASKKTDNKDSSKDCGSENTNKRKIWSEEETLEVKNSFWGRDQWPEANYWGRKEEDSKQYTFEGSYSKKSLW